MLQNASTRLKYIPFQQTAVLLRFHGLGFVLFFFFVFVLFFFGILDLQTVQVGLQFVSLQHDKLLIFSQDGDTSVLFGQFIIATDTSHQCLKSMDNQVIQRRFCEGFVVFLQISTCGLTSCTNGRSVEFVHVAGRTSLVQVGSLKLRINTSNEESNAEGTSHVGLCRSLVLVGQVTHEQCWGDGSTKDVLVVEAFVAHVLGQGSGIGRQTSNSDSNMIVNFKQFLLMTREFTDRSLQGTQDYVRVASQSNTGGPLLDRLHGVFHLKQTPFWTPYCDICIVLITEHGYKVVSECQEGWCN
mmetsp:Transcript_5607/g.8848  ORF Transcript_5607/g.8848 Transcript_5607/m.8848 type:complete len:299 (+) Transcript_5607:102-998(+)